MDMLQDVDIEISHNGKPTKVSMLRRSDVNANEVYQDQPYGMLPTHFFWADGFHIPRNVEAGHFIGTDEYFPSSKVLVTSIRHFG